MTRSNHRAFTLVELLVVVAVIALLIAILLPSLKRARYLTKEAACASNLRQLVTGFTTYATDNMGWYPKNGAYRNDEASLKNKQIWDIKTPSLPYFGDSTRVFVCPLVKELVSDPSSMNSSTYNLLFNTYGAPVSKGPIGCDSSQRLVQYDVNGNLVADETSWSAAQTWYWPYLDESGVMRKVNQTWKVTGKDQRFSLLAMDRCTGRGYPPRSRQSNHPEPKEIWTESGTLWQGESYWDPATSANYAGTDGRVVRQNLSGHVYYHEPTPEPVISVSSIGYVPEEFLAP